MSRKIAFRAWDKRRRVMGNVLEIKWSKDVKTLVWTDVSPRSIGWYLDEDVELMQFTGLTDKNGKEIYEGDIVREYGEKYQVYFDKNDCQFRLRSKTRNHGLSWISEQAGDYEVIGNVWENGDLLK